MSAAVQLCDSLELWWSRNQKTTLAGSTYLKEIVFDCFMSPFTVTGYRRAFLLSLGCLLRPNMPDMMVCILSADITSHAFDRHSLQR